ncbi:hypothetical protein ACSLMH_11915 [Flavobacterium columnare]|uniref:Uncharacterized protein n=1 Tax=Flavobacterium columnare TaxID=996 RepID=A0AAI8CH80_9FLAO|nr:hypothetical protein [Flavobacterium columnare]AMO20659.1 hypothetical protein UN65_10210 [Flavobacterium columnare]AMO20665.1 hypothetical protein UN65_10245 [Flavobacterium columnare]AUX18631.1 hypothetical protein AQ623_10360 [Flavobacterium columnare]AUX18637.1 hypothetical protein AQ623_10395 [Flavobacterium columnare]QOG57720.1 hypothetical protein HUE29_10295 [Flavobacterium columnare]
MKKIKILILFFLHLGCVDHNNRKDNQIITEKPSDIRSNLIKTVNRPYFLSSIEIKTIQKQDVVFFDDNFIVKKEKEKSVALAKYLVKLSRNDSKCCFKTGYTDFLEFINQKDNLQICLKQKVMIKFLGYKNNNKEMECYFKISSSDDFIYFIIHKNISSNKYLFETADYIKINDKLY